MNIPVPAFIPVPDPGTMVTISIALLLAGCALAGFGAVFLLIRKRNGKKTVIPWICICAGILLMANHGIQLLLKL